MSKILIQTYQEYIKKDLHAENTDKSQMILFNVVKQST